MCNFLTISNSKFHPIERLQMKMTTLLSLPTYIIRKKIKISRWSEIVISEEIKIAKCRCAHISFLVHFAYLKSFKQYNFNILKILHFKESAQQLKKVIN